MLHELRTLKTELKKNIFDNLLIKDNLNDSELATIILLSHDYRTGRFIIPRNITIKIAEALLNKKEEHKMQSPAEHALDAVRYATAIWTPKTWQDKLVEEYKYVVLKEKELFKFMSPYNHDWAKISLANKSALTEQSVILNKYKNILILRAELNGIELPNE